MESEEKKVNELTPMEKLMFTVGQLNENIKESKQKKILSNVLNIIENVLCEGHEEKMFIKFYVMTRMFVQDEFSDEDVEIAVKQAKASFKVMFNARTLFEEDINFQSKNN